MASIISTLLGSKFEDTPRIIFKVLDNIYKDGRIQAHPSDFTIVITQTSIEKYNLYYAHASSRDVWPLAFSLQLCLELDKQSAIKYVNVNNFYNKFNEEELKIFHPKFSSDMESMLVVVGGFTVLTTKSIYDAAHK